MTYVIHKQSGVSAIQEDSEPVNFYALEDGLAVYDPPDSGDTVGSFETTHHPTESTNIKWGNVKCKLTTLADVATTDYEVITKLYGITQDGEEQLIAEDISSSISTSENVEEINFDVASSSTLPELSYLSSNGSVSGKLYLNLPHRWVNWEEVTLNPATLTGWTYCKPISIPGSSAGYKSVSNISVLVTVSYTAGMNADFSDIRFIDSDGVTFLCSDRVYYTASTTATFNVKIPNVPGSPYVKTILMFYGNASATDKSAPLSVYNTYDSFEDGAYSGTRTPYPTWTNYVGTTAIESASPISGTYSLKHTGDGTTNGLTYISMASTLQNRVELDFKLTSQGTGTNAPWVDLYWRRQDANNYVRVYAYWNSTNTIVKAKKVVGGVSTDIASATWIAGSKIPTSTRYHVSVNDTLTNISVSINGTNYINSAYTASITSNKIGVGMNYNGVAVYDNIKVANTPTEYPSSITVGSALTLTPVSPDGTPADDDMQLTFSNPGATTRPLIAYIYANEKGVEGMNTNAVPMPNKAICTLGPDGIDKYVALSLQSEVSADSNCNIEYSDITFEYEVIG